MSKFIVYTKVTRADRPALEITVKKGDFYILLNVLQNSSVVSRIDSKNSKGSINTLYSREK